MKTVYIVYYIEEYYKEKKKYVDAIFESLEDARNYVDKEEFSGYYEIEEFLSFYERKINKD